MKVSQLMSTSVVTIAPEESAALAKSAVTADLATDPIFMEQYVEQMMF